MTRSARPGPRLAATWPSTMDGDPTPALTGRRRTRPTSIGCRKPRQPKPGRAPLIPEQAAVQTNRATSVVIGPGEDAVLVFGQEGAVDPHGASGGRLAGRWRRSDAE